MKHLVIILALMVALPAAQAGSCAMAMVADSIEQAADPHDCCPGDTADEAPIGEPCGDSGHCNSCIITPAAVPLSVGQIAHMRPHLERFAPVPAALPSHAAPPFRPPIF